jgi:nucleoside-diphosphate kinase
MMERTLVLLKPDAVQRQLIGRIIQRFEDVGLKIIGMKMVWIDEKFSRKHYAAHVDKPFYSSLETFITEGPIVAICIQGLHAVTTVRKIVGGTEPRSAQPGTIRGDFAHHSYEYTDKNGKAIKNLIHASGNKQEADIEVPLWFSDAEVHDYTTVHELHVF